MEENLRELQKFRYVKDKRFIDPFSLFFCRHEEKLCFSLCIAHIWWTEKVLNWSNSSFMLKQKRRFHFSARTNNFFIHWLLSNKDLTFFPAHCHVLVALCEYLSTHKCENMFNTSFFFSFFLFTLLQVISGILQIYISILHTQQKETLFEVGLPMKSLLICNIMKNMWKLSFNWALLIFPLLLCCSFIHVCYYFCDVFFFVCFYFSFPLGRKTAYTNTDATAVWGCLMS